MKTFAKILSALVVVAFVLSAGPVAHATPSDDLRARAKALQEQIAQNGAQVAALGEQLDGAQLELDQQQAKIVEATARLDAAKAEIARLRKLVRDRAAVIYRSADAPLNELDLSDTTETNAREKYGEVASRQDNQLLDKLGSARADLATEQKAAQAARDDAQAKRDQLASAKASADAASAQQQVLLSQVNGELAVLVHKEQVKADAAAAAAPPAASAPKGTSAPKGSSTPKPRAPWSGPVPNPAGGAAAAVAFARAQLGKPSQYAATGPDSYDCSGLTMRAWQAGGISLPHYSGAQGSMFPRVPLDQLQPGDLITTSSWSAHVGIWVGGGYIHATHTGDVIKFVAGSGSVVDAVRPG